MTDLNPLLAKKMTKQERLQWKNVVKNMPTHKYMTITQQENIFDYIQSQNEYEKIKKCYQKAIDDSHEDPLNPIVLNNLKEWITLHSKAKKEKEKLQRRLR